MTSPEFENQPALMMAAASMKPRIDCQACKGANQGAGCMHCGGYGFIVERNFIACCSRQAWFRPGVHTVYEGKVWDSFDGVRMVWRGGKSICRECDEKSAHRHPQL